jgi:four helix bundle protein
MVKDIQERTFRFACRIVKLHQALAKRNSSARAVISQVLRSGTAIGANLEEAEAGQSKPDFISKCRVSLKEARETLYWLRLLAATEIVRSTRLTPIIKEADEIVSILTAIVKNASTSSAR